VFGPATAAANPPSPATRVPGMRLNDRSRRRPLVQALRRRRSLQAGLVQLLYVCVGIAAGLVVPTLDVGAQIRSGDAVALIAGVTAGLLALTGIVFALLFLVVQFAATSQSPRLNLFRDSPLVWHTLGLIVGVLVYAATSALVAASEDFTTVLVPISILLLVLVALAVTRRLQLDAFRSLQLAPVLNEITTRTRAVIDGLYPAPYAGPAPQPPPAPERVVQIRWPGRPRILRQIDLPALIEQARQSAAVIRLRVMPGDLVRENAVVFEIWEPAEAPDTETLLRCLEVGIDRKPHPGPTPGFPFTQRHRPARPVHRHQRPGHRRAGTGLRRGPAAGAGRPGPRDRGDHRRHQRNTGAVGGSAEAAARLTDRFSLGVVTVDVAAIGRARVGGRVGPDLGGQRPCRGATNRASDRAAERRRRTCRAGCL